MKAMNGLHRLVVLACVMMSRHHFKQITSHRMASGWIVFVQLLLVSNQLSSDSAP